MNTTAVLVDILIIGVQVLFWVGALLFSYIFSYKSVLDLLAKYPASLLFLLIALAYSLGIIFDYIIALFFKLFKTKEQKDVYQKGLEIKIISFDKEVHKFLDNQYARLRIARATVFNLPLITIATCCFIFNNKIVHLMLTPCQTIFSILIAGISFTILSIIGWKQRSIVYWGYIKQTLKTIDELKQKEQKQI